MKRSTWFWVFKLKYVVAIAIFLGFIGFVGESSFINRIVQKQEISKLRGEIDEYTRKFNADKATLDALKNDPDAVKDIARRRYYMKADDEDIFIIEGDKD